MTVILKTDNADLPSPVKQRKNVETMRNLGFRNEEKLGSSEVARPRKCN
jgi:hypothetical protein